jgi:hypothetical protein
MGKRKDFHRDSARKKCQSPQTEFHPPVMHDPGKRKDWDGERRAQIEAPDPRNLPEVVGEKSGKSGHTLKVLPLAFVKSSQFGVPIGASRSLR